MRTRHLFVTFVMSAALSFVIAHAQTPAPAASNASIVGAWTLNKDASDLGQQPGQNGDGREGGDDSGQRGGGRRRGGGGGGGGFGGGGFGRGFGNQATPQNQDAMQKMRDALRDELQAPDHMTVVSS